MRAVHSHSLTINILWKSIFAVSITPHSHCSNSQISYRCLCSVSAAVRIRKRACVYCFETLHRSQYTPFVRHLLPKRLGPDEPASKICIKLKNVLFLFSFSRVFFLYFLEFPKFAKPFPLLVVTKSSRDMHIRFSPFILCCRIESTVWQCRLHNRL